MSHSFVHLHVHTAYSLAEGAIGVKDLAELCKDHQMPAVAVTDTNNLFGALEFAMAAAKAGVQPIIGCQVRFGHEGHQLVLLVQSETGYRNLCRLISQAYLSGDPAADAHVGWNELESCAEGLICLTGGTKGTAAQYLLHNQAKPAEEALLKLKSIFGDRLYVELQRHGLPAEDQVEGALIDLAYKHHIPLVATNDCYFPARSMHEAHDALLCIAGGRYVTEADRRRETAEHYFKSQEEMSALFADLPEAIENTAIIAQRCHYLLKSVNPVLPPFKSQRPEEEEIRVQSEEGLEWRLKNFVFKPGMDEEAAAKPYRDRLAYELGVINQMGFAGYFLIVSDFIKWAKEQNIPVGPGRGSGAGSVVAWSLKITDLDPLQFNLLFERMLNPERVSMPDFDVDFCQERRDEVIRYVQDKYGHDRVAQIITFGKLQARAVVRDVGRVLQMPYGQVDRIAKMIPANPANPVSLEEALLADADLRAERRKDESTDKLIAVALQLEGLYRHASTHAAGVVIGGQALQEMIPLYRDPRSEMPVTQFNMKFIENAGLIKFDFLGLKTLTVIQKALEFIKTTTGKDIDILQIPLDDAKTFEMLRQGHTVGVFQLESTGMRDAGRRMKLGRFEDIIALVALYRPGPMDNIPLYCDRKEGREEPDYMHDLLRPNLEETYGVMIYQEQVMQAAQALAGYTLGGADLLRRAMGKKIKEEMDAQRDMFVKGAKEHNNVPESQASHIFDQIAKFAGYGFNKSHAAAYALISYQTGWLKANYPVEFMAASMTLDKGNTDKLSVFKQELDRMGIKILPPDINKSGPDFQVEDGTIRYALAALKGVGEQAMVRVVAERANGPYKNLFDLAERVEQGTLNKKQFENLACAGAFDTIHPDRAQAAESAELVLRYAQSQAEEKAAGQTSLFGGSGGASAPPPPFQPVQEPWTQLEKLSREFDAVGFYLSAHPLDAKAGQLARLNIIPVADVPDMLAMKPSALLEMAGVLMRKQIKVSPKSGNKYAFLQLSDATGVYEVTVFSETLLKARDWLEVGETLLLKLVAEQNEEQIRYTVQDINPLEQSLSSKVRDIRIYLNDAETVQKLASVLGGTGEGPARISLVVTMRPGMNANVALPGRWNFTPQTRDAISRVRGVADIREL